MFRGNATTGGQDLTARRGAGVFVLLLSILGSAAGGIAYGRATASDPPAPAAGVGEGLPYGAVAPDPAPSVTAAVRFASAWGSVQRGESSGDWHDSVRRLATAELGQALDLTSTSTLPGAAPSGRPEVRSLAADSAIVAVPLSTGRTVVVTVVLVGGSWLVNDVQPDVGN